MDSRGIGRCGPAYIRSYRPRTTITRKTYGSLRMNLVFKSMLMMIYKLSYLDISFYASGTWY